MFDIRGYDSQLSIKSNRGYSHIRVADWSPLPLQLYPDLAISYRRKIIKRKYRNPLPYQLFNFLDNLFDPFFNAP